MSSDSSSVVYLGPKTGGAAVIMKSIASHFESPYYCSFGKYVLTCLSPKKQVIHSALPVINLFRRPVILHIHGDYVKEKSLRHPLTLLYPFAAKFAKKIVVPSIALKKDLGLRDAVVIPNFLTKKPHVKKKKYTYLTVTSFDFRDKAYGVVSIAKALVSQKNFTWSIVGSGQYFEEVKTQVSEILGSKAQFQGFKENPFEFTADVFLYWSELESFGLVLLEANAAGMPVLCNNFSAAKEVGVATIVNSIQAFEKVLEKNEFSVPIKKIAFPRLTYKNLYLTSS
jgi:glycosyltransferase involved in cell wall biosynthesis